MPNLEFLARDTVHLCINYQHSHSGRKTAGGKILHAIQNKFNQWEDAEPCIGPFLDKPPKLTKELQILRQKVLRSSMPQKQAEARLKNLDGCKRYNSFSDYVADMAALTRVYKSEVSVSYLQKLKKRLVVSLWNATAPTNLCYYFNNINRVAILPNTQM